MASAPERDNPLSRDRAAFLFGCHEVNFSPEEADDPGNPLPLRVDFRSPSGRVYSTRGFARADGSATARCYTTEVGAWRWECKNREGRCIATGEFLAAESRLPGKLTISAKDNRQFQYHSGESYLHFGYNCQLLLSDSAKHWRSAIDQAAQAGFTKIRAILANEPNSSACYFASGRKALNLAFWDEADKRLTYALQRYPHIQFQITPFGNDVEEIQRYGEGDPTTHLALRYAQERFAALPNVHWSISDGLKGENSDASFSELESALQRMGADMTHADPWGSLITDTAKRFSLSSFVAQDWYGYVSVSDLGQVTGNSILSHRLLARKPIALDRDRAEWQHQPLQPRYYFRRLFWGCLLSGGHPTYEGLNGGVIDDRPSNGVSGYYDSCNNGALRMGAHDFLHIRKFFADTEITLENWIPDDTIGGGNPLLVKAAKSQGETECIAYIANPDAHEGHSPNKYEGVHTDQRSTESETFTTFTLELPFATGKAKWYSPRTGEWRGEADVTRNSTTLLTPEPGDWVVWVKRD